MSNMGKVIAVSPHERKGKLLGGGEDIPGMFRAGVSHGVASRPAPVSTKLCLIAPCPRAASTLRAHCDHTATTACATCSRPCVCSTAPFARPRQMPLKARRSVQPNHAVNHACTYHLINRPGAIIFFAHMLFVDPLLLL